MGIGALGSSQEFPGKRRRRRRRPGGGCGFGERRGRPAPGRSRRELSLVPRSDRRPPFLEPGGLGARSRRMAGRPLGEWREGSGAREERGGHPSLPLHRRRGRRRPWAVPLSPQWVPSPVLPGSLLRWPPGTHTCQPPPGQEPSRAAAGGDTGGRGRGWGPGWPNLGQELRAPCGRSPERQARAPHPRRSPGVRGSAPRKAGGRRVPGSPTRCS